VAVVILKLKQAECALGDGRLDEAFDLLQTPGLREHRRGQDLSGDLARALAARGRKHLAAGRPTQAQGDCDKAARLAGNLPEIAEVRTAALHALMHEQQQNQHREQAVELVRRQVAQGQLSIGQQLLEKLPENDPRAAGLGQEIAARRQTIESLASKAEAALQAGDWEHALEHLLRASPGDRADARLHAVLSRTAGMLSEQIERNLRGGRPDQARSLLRRLEKLLPAGIETERLSRALEQAGQAAKAVRGGRFPEAEQALRRLLALMPDAKWINEAIAQAQRAAESWDLLNIGPLALLSASPPSPGTPEEGRGEGLRGSVENTGKMPVSPALDAAVGGTPVGDRMLIQVDGVGSYLVLRKACVSLGPVSSSPAPDVGLMLEPSVRPVFIKRSEDDYFLADSAGGAGKLLRNGQKVNITPRGRVGFRLPSSASTTAVVDLLGARMPRGDVRGVILMDREIVIGPGLSAHIRCDEMTEPAVLFVRDGRLVCQTTNEVAVDGQPTGRPALIPMGTPVRIGPVSLVALVAGASQ
jgi:tetratricopeptide (TPR) repeat protein